jgi:hypothetical protein
VEHRGNNEAAHLEPFEQLKVDRGALGHIRERIIPEKRRTYVVESPTKMCEGSGVNEIITRESTSGTPQ